VEKCIRKDHTGKIKFGNTIKINKSSVCYRFGKLRSVVLNTSRISRLLKITGLFFKKALQKRPIFSKETCNFKEPRFGKLRSVVINRSMTIGQRDSFMCAT